MFRLPIVKFFSRILNRITITVVLVALQVAWVLWAFFSLTTGRVWVNAGLQLLSLLMMLYLVRKDENSAYKIGWIALMGVLPLLGGALYLSFGNKRPAKQLRSKLQAVDDAHKADLVQQPGQTDGLDASGLGMSRYLARYGRYPAWKNTAAQYFACGEAMYPQLLQDLERAEHTIFVEYFIVHTGKMWDGVEAILRRKAAQGVDVRLIYDDFGSLLGLPTDFVVRMERAHIRCIPFNPVVPVLSLVMNHRDHRKIVVIDGRIAYTGGVNLADEYINAEQRFGYWKDAALRIEGDAAWNFTVMFLNFWNAFRPSETDYSAFRPQHSAHPVQDGIVQPYADSPLDEEPVAETVYLNLLARAEQYVYIYTPYLAVGEEMLDALEAAPHRCNYDGLTPVPAVDGRYCFAPVTHKVTLGEIVDLLEQFHAQPATLVVPEIPAGSFAKKLYSTYLSYLPKERIAFPLKVSADERGSFTELLKTENCGQFSVNISKPGITKGQHWHNTKWEFFIVVSGHGLIQERKVGCDEVMEFEVWGDKPTAVQMLPGCTHNIINLSDTENLVTLMWANEPFDPAKPDTFFLKV